MYIPLKRFVLSDRHLPQWVILGLLLFLYGPLLLHWSDGWLNKSISIEHEYFSHGLIGLPFAVYLVWLNRHRWQQLSNLVSTPESIAGLLSVLTGILLYRSNLTDLVNLSLPMLLTGLCLWFKGLPGLRLQSFPLLLVVLAAPNSIPYLLAPYTLPLQQFIAGTAGFILLQFGMEIRVEQIYLFVNDRIVEVAPYCAGLKMLFTSFYVGLMLLYWTGVGQNRVQTNIFLAGILIISITANIIRNALLTFFHGTGQEQSFHWLHDGWGGDLYSAGMLGLLMVLIQAIDRWHTPLESEAESD
jgi:cyanoexosortase B